MYRARATTFCGSIACPCVLSLHDLMHGFAAVCGCARNDADDCLAPARRESRWLCLALSKHDVRVCRAVVWGTSVASVGSPEIFEKQVFSRSKCCMAFVQTPRRLINVYVRRFAVLCRPKLFASSGSHFRVPGPRTQIAMRLIGRGIRVCHAAPARDLKNQLRLIALWMLH